MSKEFLLSDEIQKKTAYFVVCPVCDKQFGIPTRQWVYKTRNKKNRMRWFCSYKCLNEAKKIIEITNAPWMKKYTNE